MGVLLEPEMQDVLEWTIRLSLTMSAACIATLVAIVMVRKYRYITQQRRMRLR